MICFTCDQSDSNDECNRKAIDEPCHSNTLEKNHQPTNYSCMTIHKFDSRRTLSIEKKCSNDCKPEMIGCVIEIENNAGVNKQIEVGYFI